jgi:hypothetical protein
MQWRTIGFAWALALFSGSMLAAQVPTTRPADPLSLSNGGVRAIRATGASIDESTVKTTLRVDPVGEIKTIRDGVARAKTLLDQGTPVKIQIVAGVYRESAADISLAGDTLLVIEGLGEVIWSGADVVPVGNWKDEGDGLYSSDWSHDFGNLSPSWGQRNLVGHRREMLFVNGHPFKPVVIENYRAENQGQWTTQPQTYTYLGLTDPHTLPPGSFGVAEREENGNRIYLRLAPGTALRPDATIEVATRSSLLNLKGKNNVVIRNLTMEKVANPDEPLAETSAITITPSHVAQTRNWLIEKLTVRWCSGVGQTLAAQDMTLRDSTFSYNGLGGLTFVSGVNVVMERNTTNFNGWRAVWGGTPGWYIAAVKVHEAERFYVSKHTSIGNPLIGFWYDVHCHHVVMEDCRFLANHMGFFWELSQGPFVGRRILSAGGSEFNGSAFRIMNVGQAELYDSILWADAPKKDGKESNTVFMHNWTRDDYHSRMMKITSVHFALVNNVIGGGPTEQQLLTIGDYAKPETYGEMVYIGKDNTYFHTASSQYVFEYPKMKGQHDFVDLAAWQALGFETGSTWGDPGFTDVAALDFTLKPDSPLQSRAAALPLGKLSDDERRQNDWFINWVNFDPRKP